MHLVQVFQISNMKQLNFFSRGSRAYGPKNISEVMGGQSAMGNYSCNGSVDDSQTRGISKPPASGSQTLVCLAGIKRGASEEAMRSAVRAAAEAATDFSWLSPGDAVFIKPALNSGNPYPATTSPIAIAAMVELLKYRGAGRVVVGDMSGIRDVKLSPEGVAGSSRKLMESCGMARIVQDAGAEVHFFEEAGWGAFYEDTPASGSHWKNGLMMPNILKEVKHIILMPRCGRHMLAGSSLGLKAAVGYWRTDTRLECHRYLSTFQEKIADGNTVETLCKKQRLVLSAADKILTTFGPDRGHVSQPETGLVIASESVLAHDMVSLAWLLQNRPSLLYRLIYWVFTWRRIVSCVNFYIVNKLGGRRPIFARQKPKNDVSTIGDDRVLNRAYQVLGGKPKVILQAANSAVPDDLRNRLSEMVA
jgi:uncharacterized protein (DUF362 family)